MFWKPFVNRRIFARPISNSYVRERERDRKEDVSICIDELSSRGFK